jgi:hypothetical protein
MRLICLFDPTESSRVSLASNCSEKQDFLCCLTDTPQQFQRGCAFTFTKAMKCSNFLLSYLWAQICRDP